MTEFLISRRKLFAGSAATAAALALPGCATLPGFSFTDAIRRMLLLSSERAFARMTQDGGFWDQQVARVGFGEMLGARGNVLSNILTSALFKSRLEDALADIAIEGSARAAPIVADTVRTIGFANAVALVRGGPSAATSFLRGEMGGELIDVLVPEIGDALRVARDPLVGQALSALTGVDIPQVANTFAREVDDTIWNEISREEGSIRANPRATNDPLIIGVFGAGAAL